MRSFKLEISPMLDSSIHSIQPVLSHLQIEELKHTKADLGSAASSHYARGLCSMPNLRSLKLDCVKLSDEFYSTMASEASNSKVITTTKLLETYLFSK